MLARGIIFKLVSPESIARAPREMRAIAGYTHAAAAALGLDATRLVGGYVVLRVVSPAIVSPETFKLTPSDKPISPKSRRNLILLAKVLQVCPSRAFPNGVFAVVVRATFVSPSQLTDENLFVRSFSFLSLSCLPWLMLEFFSLSARYAILPHTLLPMTSFQAWQKHKSYSVLLTLK